MHNSYYLSQKNDAGESQGGWHDQMIHAFVEAVSDKCFETKIVDVGCFKGYGLLHLKSLGYSNLFGIDLIKENVDYFIQRGIEGTALDMHDMSVIENTRFDFLFMHHSIEHSIDAKKVLLEAIRISKEGLIVFPIERNQKKIVNPPHYSTFRNEEDVFNLLDDVKINHVKSLNLKTEFRRRLGEEIWVWYTK